MRCLAVRFISDRAQFPATDSASGSHFFDIFHLLHQRRAITLLVYAVLDTIAGSAVNGWLYFDWFR
jgi:hypothetical protein